MPTKKKAMQPAIEVVVNNALPNTWIDMVSLSVRDDDVCLLRFSTMLPEGCVEQQRAFVKKEILKNLVDVLSENLNYYPKKKTSKPTSKKNQNYKT